MFSPRLVLAAAALTLFPLSYATRTRHPAVTRNVTRLGPPGSALDPCKLLTKDQVATVLPNHDGGDVAHAGGSMIKGVDAYQCSYLNPQAQLLTVIVNVAVDDKRFEAIKPDFSLTEAQKVPVGEAGWLRGQPNDLKLTAVKGRSVLDLELLAPGAKTKGDALVALGKAAIAHL
jgi:hypothetical protein